MQSSALQVDRAAAAARIAIVSLFFVSALFTPLAIGVSTAEAQSRRAAAQLQDVPAPDVAEPRAPRDPFPPFGYGGGPREPRDTAGLGDIFDRFREFVLRLFR